MKKGKTSFNLITNVLAFGINIVISFWLTPYVTENLGNEAYGFISLANAIISYLTIISTALNAYASRFICLSYFKSELEDSNKYYSSILCSNIIIVFALSIVLGPFIDNISVFFNISEILLPDVRILFVLVFVNYYITLLGVVFSVGTVINNRLDIDAIKNIINCLLKAILIYLGFRLIGKHVWIVGVSTLICTVLGFTINAVYQLSTISDLHFKKIYISWKYTKEVIKSGIWSSIGSIGNVLNSGLDIWVTNRFLDGTSMGYIAISTTLTTMLVSFAGTLTNIYWPRELEAYSVGNIDDLMSYLKKSVRMQGIVASLVLAGFLSIGKDFLRLWVPSQNAEILYIVISIGITSYALTAITRPLGAVFGLVNKLKLNAILNICIGLVNIVSMLILLNVTTLGVFAVSLTSAIPSLIYSLIYTPIHSSKCLKCNVSIWIIEIFRFLMVSIVLIIVFCGIDHFIYANTWGIFIIKVSICTVVGMTINFFTYLTKSDRESLMSMLFKY